MTAYHTDDPMFAQPYIDYDEWHDKPVRHRYVHGGFKDTDTRFSFYFPPGEQYQGRFFQYITPVPDSETLSIGASGEEDKIGFAIDSGAYFVESNGGGKYGAARPGTDIDPTIGAYRANAAVAQFSRVVAMQMYGSERPYGYAFGGSGGGYRTIGGMENTGVWDGAVPFVVGSPMSIPNVFTVRTYGMRVLKDKLPAISDAVDAGSGKDPFNDTGLNEEEHAALVEVSKMGFPLAGWHAYQHLGLHAFSLLFPAVVALDPDYFRDFWVTPGYEGFEPPPSLQKARIDYHASIAQLIYGDDARKMGLKLGRLAGRARGRADDAWMTMEGGGQEKLPVALRLSGTPGDASLGTDLIVMTGDAAGSRLRMLQVQGDIVLLAQGGEGALGKLRVGDELRFDNSNFLAVQTYHRHQVPDPGFYVWDQYRDKNGEPIYPQRPMLLGPLFAREASGTLQSGRFKGKMILVENLYDTEAFPWQADWYRSQVQKNLGEATDKSFRLWFTDHANHSDFTKQVDPLHTVSYLGVLQQALRDLAAWVEKGVEPPATTSYEVVDGQVVVPASAAERRGIQPVVGVAANGGERAEVATGATVGLVGSVEVPPGTGEVVSARWDLDGSGEFAIPGEIEPAGDNRVTVKLSHTYKEPGTYFATLRVASQRQGDAQTPFARVQNLGRARIVVQ